MTARPSTPKITPKAIATVFGEEFDLTGAAAVAPEADAVWVFDGLASLVFVLVEVARDGTSVESDLLEVVYLNVTRTRE